MKYETGTKTTAYPFKDQIRNIAKKHVATITAATKEKDEFQREHQLTWKQDVLQAKLEVFNKQIEGLRNAGREDIQEFVDSFKAFNDSKDTLRATDIPMETLTLLTGSFTLTGKDLTDLYNNAASKNEKRFIADYAEKNKITVPFKFVGAKEKNEAADTLGKYCINSLYDVEYADQILFNEANYDKITPDCLK